MRNVRLVAEGLAFPEGPVALPDGSLLVVELAAGCLTVIEPDGGMRRIAVGRGPNGAALGPDGKVYVCDNGGYAMTQVGDLLFPGVEPGSVTEPDGFEGGAIRRVDLDTGEVETVCDGCDGRRFRGPNDLVFDSTGGLWFTDHGKVRLRDSDRGGLYYVEPGGRSVREAVFPLAFPNGVGLSPDGTAVYVAETYTGRLWGWDVPSPGRVRQAVPFFGGGRLLAGLPGLQLLDSLAVEAGGNVCVATIANPGITVVAPDGSRVEHVPLPGDFADPVPTNICFGGRDLRTAYITLSSSGRVIACDWPRPGAPLAFAA